MRSLYLKIFLAFWLLMMLIVAANMALTWTLARHFEERLGETDHISQYADQALDRYRAGGSEALAAWRRQLLTETGLRVRLLNAQGVSLSGESLPPHLRHRLDRDGPHPHDRGRRPITWSLERDGQSYRFVILNPRELIDLLYSGATLAWRLGLSVLIVALLSLLLARYLVRPIRLLQGASRALAAGDLDTRVAGVMKGRRDELGQLGQDFDHMAERLQALLQGQRQLLRDVSHELRTPLARQRVAIELARLRPDPGEALDRIEREAELLDALIEEILLLVRMNGDSQQAPRERVELRGLLEELVADANFEGGRVTLEAPQDVTCAVNPRQVYRALENGVRNALKYSAGPVTVRLERQRERAVIQVLDRGPGLPEAMLGRVFDPFVRADAAREAGGWGLGLAIAAQAVRQHGGTIEARNRDGGGLCLRIELPA